DQLLLRPGFQNHRVFVETLDSPRKLHPAHQVDGDVAALFAGTVEKAVLDCILLRWFFHLPDSPVQKIFKGIANLSHIIQSGQEFAPSPWGRGSGAGGREPRRSDLMSAKRYLQAQRFMIAVIS